MTALQDLLADNPLLLLFAVVALGYPLGRIAVRGVSLGAAAILFAGLGVGALDARLRLPEVLTYLGLVLFVYSVGLASGPGFVASLRRHGAPNALLVVVALGAGVVAALVASRLLGLDAGVTAGLLAGSLTNTPSLAAALDALRAGGQGPGSAAESASVVAYSVAYPIGVLAPILLLAAAGRRWAATRPAGARQTAEWPAQGPATSRALQVATVRVTHPDAVGRTVRELRADAGVDVLPGRVRHADGGRGVEIATDDSVLQAGDLVTLIGRAPAVARMTEALGEASDEAIHLDRSQLDVRRVFVSNRDVAGRTLGELDLPGRFGATVTALRRGDADWLPHGDTVLQLGDRVRVLTRGERMPAVSAFLGDSYRESSEFDVLTFSFGMVLGVALGLLPIPLPGGVTVSLGLAGGPLVTAMLLGARGRTGPLVWGIPYATSLTLRQLGLILFFAGVGTRSGSAFGSAAGDPATLWLVAAGAATTTITAGAVLAMGRYVLRVPAGLLAGMVAGVHTQPAALSFALDAARDDKPNEGYAAVYPLATILKLLVAQLVVRFMG